MLTRAQRNLLRHLASYPDALVEAWDVPRDLSLPGLSDAMGVVRSGLNAPLKALESAGFVTKRMAHVIGGGSRRRHVHHITAAGRAWLEDNEGGTAAPHQPGLSRGHLTMHRHRLLHLWQPPSSALWAVSAP